MGENTNEDIKNPESGEANEEVYYDPHPLRPAVNLMLNIIDSQLEVISYLQGDPEDVKGDDPCAVDKELAITAAIRVIRRMQDRLLKMSIDLPLDATLISVRKYSLKNSPPTVSDSDETQAQ